MELEPVESREFPGSVTVIDQIRRTTSFQNNLTMENSRSVRDAHSAGSPHLRLSVLRLWTHDPDAIVFHVQTCVARTRNLLHFTKAKVSHTTMIAEPSHSNLGAVPVCVCVCPALYKRVSHD